MTDYLLVFILFTLIIGTYLIRKKLIEIKKLRDIMYEDFTYTKQIIIYLGHKEGFFNGCSEK